MSTRRDGTPAALARAPATVAAVAVALIAAIAIAGCGIGPGSPAGHVQLTITREFGAQTISELPAPSVGASRTVLDLLRRNATVITSARGYVQSIDGYAAGGAGARQTRWSYFVNGIEVSKPPAKTQLNTGDQVWFDVHEAGAATDVPAVVGSFPEPFVHGSGGRKLPVVIECTDPSQPACRTVYRALSSIGIPVSLGGFLLAAGTIELRVLVGSWPTLRHDPAAAQIERGPQVSGVFARLNSSGSAITVLDQFGNAIRALGPSSGLVAATRFRGDEPVWVVTGTDNAGLTAAAGAFEPGALHDRFALAISNDVGIALPELHR